MSTENFHMIDVGEKTITRRKAIATGVIRMKSETMERIRAGQMPKGNVLALAEAAGIMAAKKTPELLPLCHPLILDSVSLRFEMSENEAGMGEIRASCEVVCHGKTGVEMEALVGAQAALLCIYDLTKGVDPVLVVSDLHLQLKEGGKSGRWIHSQPKVLDGVRVCVLTVSDRCSQGKTEDLTGPKLASFFKEEGATVLTQEGVPDEVTAIQTKLQYFLKEWRPDVVVTTGGTGLSPRDVTPEAMTPLIERSLDGFSEKLRTKGAEKTSHAYLSRSVAGLSGKTLLFALPGSVGAVKDSIEIFKDLLPHALEMVRGGGHE